MDSMHDLGGKQGFDTIEFPAHAHEETWEPRVRAIQAFAVKNHIYNMDESRYANERMRPAHYMSALYFERQLTASATLWVEKGLITKEELEALVDGSFPLSGPVASGRLAAPPQSFEIGETVRVKYEFVSGHHRMPGYIRGKTGVVVGISSPTPFPDAAAHNMQVTMEPTYDVRFRSTELWPDSCDEAFNHVGVFQSYLEKVA